MEKRAAALSRDRLLWGSPRRGGGQRSLPPVRAAAIPLTRPAEFLSRAKNFWAGGKTKRCCHRLFAKRSAASSSASSLCLAAHR
jgi:hypothetical protein